MSIGGSHSPARGQGTPQSQLKLKNDSELSALEAVNLSLKHDNDELKRHREELRALGGFYKEQNDRLKEELAVANRRVLVLECEAEERNEGQRQAKVESGWRERAVRAEAELGVLKVERARDSAELDACRTENEALKETVADMRKAAEVFGMRQALDRSNTPPPAREPTPTPVDDVDLDLEYVSDEQSASITASAPSAPNPWASHPQGITHPEKFVPVPMDPEPASASPSDPRGSSTTRSKASSSVMEVRPMAGARSRSPSLEILDPPPSTSHAAIHGSKRGVRKDNAKTMQPFFATPASQSSAKALGKRKAGAVHETPSVPAKKFKPAPVPAANPAAQSQAVVYTSVEPGNLQARLQQPQEAVKMELDDDSLPPHNFVPSQQPTPIPPTPTAGATPQRPKFKFKQEDALVLPESSIAAYLADAPDLRIEPAPSEVHVQRAFLRLAYGGSDQHFLQYISRERNPSSVKGKASKKGEVKGNGKSENEGGTEGKGDGKRRLVFPMPDMNPAMPVIPGHTGLLFASRHEVLENAPWGVFRRHLDGKTARWLYLGEYECKLVGKMTREEFAGQRESVKRRWAKLLMEQRAFECYTSMRARIALRKAGLLPVDDKEAERELLSAEMVRITGKALVTTEEREAAIGAKRRRSTKKDEGGSEERGEEVGLTRRGPLPVSEEDIIEAFERGDEGIDIIRMQCVSYDHVFAQDIEAKYPDYPKMLKMSKEKGKAKGSKPATSSTTSTSGTASGSRKRAVPRSLALSDSGLDDNDEDGTSVSVPRQTSQIMNSSARRSARVKSKPRKTWIEDSDEDGGEGMDAVSFHSKPSVAGGRGGSKEAGSGGKGGEVDDEGDLSYVSEE